ncbi:MAG: AraC family transcriptional regulator [Xanthomonadaceae bacterium]|nr:AraC family transcriptional regulator [Xanthomonadaceae bacterium]MDE1964746.1 helix-turn-helix domain-containing protein [Xanthomonadaceae bacterium]
MVGIAPVRGWETWTFDACDTIRRDHLSQCFKPSPTCITMGDVHLPGKSLAPRAAPEQPRMDQRPEERHGTVGLGSLRMRLHRKRGGRRVFPHDADEAIDRAQSACPPASTHFTRVWQCLQGESFLVDTDVGITCMSKSTSAPLQMLTYMPGSASAVAIEVQGLSQSRHMKRMEPHAHMFFEVVVVKSGRGRHRVDGLDHETEPGMVFVLPPGSVHDMRAMEDVDGWSILFEADGIDASLSLGLTPIGALPGGFMFDLFRQPVLQMTRPIRLDPVDLASFGARIEQLGRELAERHAGYEHAARATLQLLLIDLTRLAPWLQGHTGGSPAPADIVSRAFADIDQHFREPSALTQAATRLGYSVGHLTTRLRQLTGRTYGEWVIERRMIESRRLLSATDRGIGEIAQALGYAEVESFIRRFRARHGLTPSAWRDDARAAHRPES